VLGAGLHVDTLAAAPDWRSVAAATCQSAEQQASHAAVTTSYIIAATSAVGAGLHAVPGAHMQCPPHMAHLGVLSRAASLSVSATSGVAFPKSAEMLGHNTAGSIEPLPQVRLSGSSAEAFANTVDGKPALADEVRRWLCACARHKRRNRSYLSG
jgi:hypothetical protein